MGITKDIITLVNTIDLGNVKRGLMKAQDVRAITVTATADTGALKLVIPEHLRETLGLEIESTVYAKIATGARVQCGVSEPVTIRWRNRVTSCEAWVVPNGGDVLLGAIPMEGMDIMVDPVNQRIIGVHGDEPLGIMY